MKEEEWQEMKQWCYDLYITQNKTSSQINVEMLEKWQRDQSPRQIKTRFTTKWGWWKNSSAVDYGAMHTVLHGLGPEKCYFVTHLIHASRRRSKAEIAKEMGRKEAQKAAKLLEKFTFDEAVGYLRSRRIDIYLQGNLWPTGTTTTRPAHYTTQYEHGETDEDTSSDDDEENDEVRVLERAILPTAFENPDTHQYTHEDDVRQLSTQLEQLSVKAQHGPMDEYTQWSLDQTVIDISFLDDCPRDDSLFYGSLNRPRKPLSSDQVKSLLLDFYQYYIQLTEVEDFNIYRRRVARQRLVEVMDSGTNHTLPAICKIWCTIGEAMNTEQLDMFGQDVLQCIWDSINPDVQYFSPIVKVGLYLNTRQVRTGQRFQSQELVETGLANDFEHSIAYFVRSGKSNTADAAILRSYHAWFVWVTGHPIEASQMLVASDCLPQAEKILGEWHIAVVNCYRLAAFCYHDLDNADMADWYLRNALCKLQGCPSHLQFMENSLKLQRAESLIERRKHGEAIEVLMEVVDFRFRAFGATNLHAWAVLHQLLDLLRVTNRIEEAEALKTRYYGIYYEAKVDDAGKWEPDTWYEV